MVRVALSLFVVALAACTAVGGKPSPPDGQSPEQVIRRYYQAASYPADLEALEQLVFVSTPVDANPLDRAANSEKGRSI